jgi:hypothetical protein
VQGFLNRVLITKLVTVVSAHEINHLRYANEIQLGCPLRYITLLYSHYELSHIVQCVADVPKWLLENRLIMNPAKTDVVAFGTAQRLCQYTNLGVVDVAGASIQFTGAVN